VTRRRGLDGVLDEALEFPPREGLSLELRHPLAPILLENLQLALLRAVHEVREAREAAHRQSAHPDHLEHVAGAHRRRRALRARVAGPRLAGRITRSAGGP